MKRLSARFGNIGLSLLLATGLAALHPFAATDAFAQSKSDKPKDSSKSAADTSKDAQNKPKDLLILKSGRTVEGYVIEENAREIKMQVVVSGIKAVTTYPKSDVLELKRGAVKTEQEKAATATPAKTEAKKASDDKSKDDSSESIANDDPDRTTLYVVELKGRFGFDISKTPLEEVFEEADKYFNDAVDGTGEMAGKTVVDPAKRDKNLVVLKMDTIAQQGFGSVFVAENIGPVVENQIVNRGRRVVYWVKMAAGGSAFMPFISPEIYFTSDGKLGGIGDLDDFSSGDHMVDEKLIGAFIGHASGFAIKGGYGDHLAALKAMLRRHYWLFVRFEGGKPVYLERALKAEDGDGWTMLSDDGEGENKDKAALVGNDLFILEPDWADKLGISKGVADTIDDLAFRLGIHRNYAAISGKDSRGQKALTTWKEGLGDAIDQIRPPQQGSDSPPGKLWIKFSEAEVNGDFAERRQARGIRINILRQIRSLMGKYAEVFDPEGAQRAQIDALIAAEQLAAEQDARANRRGGDSGGGDGGGGNSGGGIR